VTPDGVSRDIVYISEVIGARKLKSDAEVAMKKCSDLIYNVFLRVAGALCAQLKLFQTSKIFVTYVHYT